MPAAQSLLGDSHNFGRRVSVRAGRVLKPRTVLWEWLVLGTNSPLRRLLADAAEEEGVGRELFAFLPRLEFSGVRSRTGGEVQRLELAPLGRLSLGRRRELATAVGRAVAFFAWLGVGDLHWENLALGAGADGRIVFGPLDIELVLADFALPTETRLLPDTDAEYAVVYRHAAGVRRALPFLGKPVSLPDLSAMAAAYRGMLDFLERHARAIASVFAGLPSLAETPIRVCLRGTDEYVRARSIPLWPPLLDAEAEQLARGDIPYFFRLYGRPGIHYYAERTLRRHVTLPSRGDVPKLEPLLSLARGLRSPARRKLREQGLFALLGAFDHAELSGRHACGDFEVGFGARSLVVELASGDELRARRDLGAFVGSVYLPCRCGEVRSVLVPGPTRCDGERRTRGVRAPRRAV